MASAITAGCPTSAHDQGLGAPTSRVGCQKHRKEASGGGEDGNNPLCIGRDPLRITEGMVQQLRSDRPDSLCPAGDFTPLPSGQVGERRDHRANRTTIPSPGGPYECVPARTALVLSSTAGIPAARAPHPASTRRRPAWRRRVPSPWRRVTRSRGIGISCTVAGRTSRRSLAERWFLCSPTPTPLGPKPTM